MGDNARAQATRTALLASGVYDVQRDPVPNPMDAPPRSTGPAPAPARRPAQPPPTTPPAPAAVRHVWVLTGTERTPALLIGRHRTATGQWIGRVVFARTDGDALIVVEKWLPYTYLEPT